MAGLRSAQQFGHLTIANCQLQTAHCLFLQFGHSYSSLKSMAFAIKNSFTSTGEISSLNDSTGSE